ncbi:MAG TPA: hypothetical protein VH394_00775 [Thermoanaerobaculia bacterium]|jgi:hypothetical protein|nr:hypothetical protein [Thermoanaerobaculia bacterium]
MRNALVLLASLLLAAPALAWKTRDTRDCQPWREGRELRCVFDNPNVPTATVRVTNTSDSEVSFSYDEWHSRCGQKGGRVETNRYRDVEPGESIVIQVLAPGNGVSCRESFVAECKRGSKPTPCTHLVRVQAALWVGNLQ